MFGRISGQKWMYSSAIRQENTVCYLKSTSIFVRYEALLERKVTARNFDGWAQFDFEGRCIALYNNAYDEQRIKEGKELEKHYNQAYLDFIKERQIRYGNNAVLNFWTKDLKKEHDRIEDAKIGPVSEYMYLNIMMPYPFFTVTDPDGNMIEITGTMIE